MTKQNQQQQQRPVVVIYGDLATMIINLSEKEFWKLVSARLNMPLSQSEMKESGITDEEREYWVEEYLIDELFLQLAGTKEIIRHNGKCVTVLKYYSQALRLRKWIPIAKPTPEFIVNISDLTVRIAAELKALDKEGSHVLKQTKKIILMLVYIRISFLPIIGNVSSKMK